MILEKGLVSTCAAILLLLLFTHAASAAIHDPNAYTSLGTLNPSSNVTVDTSGTNPSMSGGATFTGVVDNGVAVFAFDSVDVPSGVTFTVSGTRPLAILSQGSFDFSGTLNINAVGTTAGAGGYNGAGSAGNGFGPGAGFGDSLGAGGGAYGGSGGSGGGNTQGGFPYGDLATTLQGGSGGGMSTWGGGGVGGGGGGAVEFGARLALDVDGTINATGAAGGGGVDGGGGGAGGGILLHSTHNDVTLTGSLNANGGIGGTGSDYGGGGGGGGRIYLQGVNITNNGTHTVNGGTGGGGSFGAGFAGSNGVYTTNTIVPPNFPPTVDDLTITLNENSSYDFTLQEFEDEFDDPDPNDQLEELRIVTLPANGTLELAGTPITATPFDIDRADIDDLTYIPNAYYNGPDQFEYNASDGIDWATDTADVLITVDPYNNAPVLDNSGDPWLNDAFTGIVSPRGTSVPTLLSRAAGGNPITDADAIDPRGIAIISANSANGDWEFTLDDGATWSNFNNVSDTNALLLDDHDDVQIRFTTSSFAGTINPAIEFRAWDQYEGTNGTFYDITANGGTGGMNAFSTASETARIDVVQPPDISIERNGNTIADGGTDDIGTVAPLARQSLTYTVRNLGAGPLTLTGSPRVEVGGLVNATAYLIVVPGETVGPNGTTDFVIHITPQATGAFAAEITVPSNDPVVLDYDFTIEGTAGPLASKSIEHDGVVLAPNTQLDLGRVSTSTMRSLEFTVRNLGADDLGSIAVEIASPTNVSAVVDPQPGQSSLAPTESTTFGVDLLPFSSGRFNMLVRVTSDDPSNPVFVIPVTGRGSSSTVGTMTIERLPNIPLPTVDAVDDLGNLLLGQATPITWQLSNTGFDDLTDISAFVTNQSNAAVSVSSAPASELEPGESSPVTLDIEPLGSGTFSFRLIVESSDFQSPSREVLVIGEGTTDVEPRLMMYATSHLPVGHGESTTLPGYWPEIHSAYPFVIANQGTDTLNVTIPVQLAALVNCHADIVEQPDAGPVLTLAPHTYAVVRTSMNPINETLGTSFDVLVTSNDPTNPVYRITAITEGPVGSQVRISQGRGCAIGSNGTGGTLQMLLLLALLLAVAARRRQAT